ncbi:MAG TPA: dihydroxyacetone kinase subunit DhaK, partial [Thermomicrobiales bacterium]|nr:dihydroxyacetone kinase subunit DhaK [Thermomicrobiales bacterium]
MFNDPIAFKEEMLDGFAAAYGRYLRRVPDTSGVVAVNAPLPGRVALVIGGGAGHYPTFCGLVGDGLATGAVVGEIFSSPSAEQVYRVAKAADAGAGVIFGVVNYSGDVMNFGIAQQRLQAEGIDARSVVITDDVLSAPPEEAEKRRGIAGAFYVNKTGGASAARGDDIGTVEHLMRRANARVRSAGVAFDSCTIPGQKEPLFTVAPGKMEVGLGIHGEPGVRSIERLPASDVATLLVDAILAEAPADAGSRAAVLVNGLGATKYEELFVLYHDIAPLLAKAGIEPYEPLVGEFVTSLNMEGCSLTLFWLDDDLQALHDATAATPAFT